MSEKIQRKGGIYEPCSDIIPPNWGNMRNKFRYTTLSEMLSPFFMEVNWC